MPDKNPFVVIVDDQSTGRKILEQIIRDIDSNVVVEVFTSPIDALERIHSRTPDLVLTDYKMPVMDGIQLIREIRAISACRDVPVVVVTVVEDRSVRYQALDAGATDFLTRPIDQYECRARCKNLLTLRRQQKIISDRAKWLEVQVARGTREILARERETLLRLAKAGEYRDEGTGNHVLRIARYTRLLAEALQLSRRDCEELELAAPMHDIGKVGVPDSILLKEGPLDEQETEIMREHPDIGHEILRDSESRYINLGAEIALSHHEKYDGTGYPNGLKGDAISLAGRIVAVVDVFDALTTRRPYKEAWLMEDAVDYIRNASGSHMDPDVVGAFLGNLERFRQIRDELSDD
ncbi:cyclic di-GMP phosphodiesterase response regulator RpfG [bacterium BMS3Bbin11]|nr:cyclic di-GMP phosphodiesterase response regulator RpfG [bacterium BMS3Abin11]GBE45923.1 cyclic di-GMP phosphodiesterase response regulator RpfG [bacterium BMS3Bbin11]GMT40563.1 MAG: two-component system response regulator [bacterium]